MPVWERNDPAHMLIYNSHFDLVSFIHAIWLRNQCISLSTNGRIVIIPSPWTRMDWELRGLQTRQITRLAKSPDSPNGPFTQLIWTQPSRSASRLACHPHPRNTLTRKSRQTASPDSIDTCHPCRGCLRRAPRLLPPRISRF